MKEEGRDGRTGEGRECSRGTTRDSSAFCPATPLPPLDPLPRPRHLSLSFSLPCSACSARTSRERPCNSPLAPPHRTAPPPAFLAWILVNAAGASFRVGIRTLLQDITTGSGASRAFDATLASPPLAVPILSLSHAITRAPLSALPSPIPAPTCRIAMHARGCYSATRRERMNGISDQICPDPISQSHLKVAREGMN